MQPLTMFMGNLQYVIVAVVGGLRVASGAISDRRHPGVHPVLAAVLDAAHAARVDDERVPVGHRVVRAGRSSSSTPRSRAPTRRRPPARRRSRGRVEFRDVTFSYDPDRPLIESLSLVAEPGQTIAIVGPTGAGKTTLVNLIMRFYELERRRDHARRPRHLHRCRRDELRSKIGMVLQDTWLFGGTIRDNIAYGNPDATEEQILEAARATYVDRFVHSLPDGYDTLINEEGDNISAGQKQLLTIAARVPRRSRRSSSSTRPRARSTPAPRC